MNHMQGWIALAVLGMLAGCAPSARFTRVDCHPVSGGDDLEGMAFTSSVSTVAMRGRQLIYRVRLLDAADRPLRSGNDRFRDAAGDVAAAKTLMVFDSPWNFDDVTIAIPAEELEIRPQDRPVRAEFALLSPEGEVLARQVRPLPLYGGPAPEFARAAPPPPPEPNEPRPAPDGSNESDAAMAGAPSAEAPRASERPQAHPDALAGGKGRDDLFSMMYEAYQRSGPPPAPSAVPPPAEAPPPAAQPAARVRPQPQSSSEQQEKQPASEHRSTEPKAQPTPPSPQEPPAPRPAPRKQTPEVPDYRIYVVERGDTLTSIARRLYGKTARWLDIFQLNRDQLDSPDLIYEGMQLRVPLK